MAYCEVDSFVTKFKHLWYAGLKATLIIKALDGEATVEITAGLGYLPHPTPPPFHVPRHHDNFHSNRGPSYWRRQERRQAARNAAVQVPVEGTEGSKAAEACKLSTVTAEKVETNDNSVVDVSVKETESENAEKARSDFPCLICDFHSNWENGLQVHMSRKHVRIKQVDGNTTVDDDDDIKYCRTSPYWKTGVLGTVYQIFVDVNEIIETSELNEYIKIDEKAKALEARKATLEYDAQKIEFS